MAARDRWCVLCCRALPCLGRVPASSCRKAPAGKEARVSDLSGASERAALCQERAALCRTYGRPAQLRRRGGGRAGADGAARRWGLCAGDRPGLRVLQDLAREARHAAGHRPQHREQAEDSYDGRIQGRRAAVLGRRGQHGAPPLPPPRASVRCGAVQPSRRRRRHDAHRRSCAASPR